MPSKIRILFLGANPSDTTRLALGREVREITDRLHGTPEGERFEIVQAWAVRVSDLQAALLRHRPQIVHFSGHGRGDRSSSSPDSIVVSREMLPADEPRAEDLDGEILVEDDAGRAKPIPASALANLFGIVGGVRCVVLNACHSAAQAEAIRQHVDAVVGMRRSIKDAAAISFAWAFYQGLGFGVSLSQAFELGKNQIELSGFGDGEVPRFLTRKAPSMVRDSVAEGAVPGPPVQDGPVSRRVVTGREEEDIVDPFLARVERIAKLRHPGARITRGGAPPPFAGVLEVEVDAGGFFRMSLVAALDHEITEELAARFSAEIDGPFRRGHPLLRSTLVHRGQAASVALRAELDRQGIELKTFDGYQGLFDLEPYLAWQTREFEKNPAYIPTAYVDPPAWIKVAGNRELQHTENALQSMWELLATPTQRRFLLVLGEFGAGKTFLLRELCRQMVKDKHPVLPVLLEMSKLEKQHSLAELLGAHFSRADVSGYNYKAFEYMLEEGRVALFFDGFDELADKVTYDSATGHLETVLSAARGQAKVVLSSRRQHFLTEGEIHKAVEREFARKAESAVQGGYRLIMLEPFGEPQIRRYLRNVLTSAEAADARYRLIGEVKDLLGLSHNPRMLSFIAEIPEESLREAKKEWGEITSAKLYELLVKQWLDFEHERSRRQGWSKGISREALSRGVASLALSMWHARVKTVSVGEIHEGLGQALAALGEPAFDPALLTHVFGSGSLLVRDEEGRFSFVHRSVMEWLVAKQAADELVWGQDPPALVVDEISALMADFFAAMAGREHAVPWAREKMAGTDEGISRKNAALLLTRMKERVDRVNFEGQDLRGRDFSGIDWRGANLRAADLRGAMLKGADLQGASLVGANLSRADLRGVNLTEADLAEADVSFVRAEGVDLSMAAHLDPARLRGAHLLSAKGIPDERHDALLAVGAVPPVLRHVEPMWTAASPCKGVAWSPDGSMVATAHEDGTVWLVDTVANAVLRILPGHKGGASSVAFAPDGKTLACGSSEKSVRLWDVATGRMLRAFEGHASAVLSVAFAPDGKTLASGSYDNTVRLWDVATGRKLYAVEGHASPVCSVAFAPNGETLASGSYDNTVRLWDVATGQMRGTFFGHVDPVWTVAFAFDGKTLASGSSDNTVRLWDVATGRELRTFEGHTYPVRCIAFSPDGKTVASGSEDNTIRHWEVATGRALRVLGGHTYPVRGIAFSPDGKRLASGSSDKSVRLWDIATGHTLHAFEEHASPVRSIAFSPDCKTLASASYDSTIRLWDVMAGRALCAIRGHVSPLWSVAFAPDGKTLASSSSDSTIRLWDVATGRELRSFGGHAAAVYSVAFSPDGKKIASASKDSIVRLWDVATGRALRSFGATSVSVYSVAFAPDGKALVSGSDDGTVHVWDVVTSRPLRAIEAHTSAVASVAFAPGGKTLASGSDDDTVRLWDIATGRALRAFEGHTSGVRCVAFAPNGKTLGSSSADNTIRLWDVGTGRVLHTLEGHGSEVLSVAFSPDGRTLASGSSDNTIRLWDVATGRCLAILLATREGWVAFTPDGRYKLGGDIAGSFWHVAGLCRFDPGELDEYLDLRLPDDAPFLPANL
ncbi:pentapeptide repeat-containing protein [Polyangium sp. 15x6]|uniref:WD40 domain-containing protein n=1 Tax=Polyangium sp. 15x6 TaxID=3042687 RepID=UPI002499CFF1|nr:pentapeptide repeat-containing protein [Polyangium sp. 15x6]MDI3287808.1 pentapeptide repeat-containing protein [Polyangium sp. 15x6]